MKNISEQIPTRPFVERERSKEELAYLAGFLDGDGSILAQLVRREDYRYKYQVRVSIQFFQKTKRHWSLEKIEKEIGGKLRYRKDGMSELSIVGPTPVKTVLEQLLPYLRIKKNVAELVLSIIEASAKVKTRGDFLEVCKQVDKIAEHTDSKKRTITTETVIRT